METELKTTTNQIHCISFELKVRNSSQIGGKVRLLQVVIVDGLLELGLLWFCQQWVGKEK